MLSMADELDDELRDESGESPQIPKSVVRAVEQLNEGESVSKEEMMGGLGEGKS